MLLPGPTSRRVGCSQSSGCLACNLECPRTLKNLLGALSFRPQEVLQACSLLEPGRDVGLAQLPGVLDLLFTSFVARQTPSTRSDVFWNKAQSLWPLVEMIDKVSAAWQWAVNGQWDKESFWRKNT